MPQEALPVAVIGVGGFGGLSLQAMRHSDMVKVVGVSDKDPRKAEKAGQAAGVPAYSDNRSLLAETRPKAVFMAVPPAAAPELLTACAERGIHVWKELPLGRNLSEALAFVQLMEKSKLKFAVGTQRRFATGYSHAREMVARLGQVFLGRAHYLFNWGPTLTWRGDKSSAGGGAILELGYHPIDLLVWMLGLPEEVYGIAAGGNRPERAGPGGESLPLYDTDDTGAAILRYSDGCMATVVTTRVSGPVSEELCLHGRGGSLTANSNRCVLRDPDGNVLGLAEEQGAQISPFHRQIEAFATAVISGGKHYQCSGRENLLNQAVIEAIYLSNKTGQPENPMRLLKTNGLTVEKCLSHCQPAPKPAPAAEKPEAEPPDSPQD